MSFSRHNVWKFRVIRRNFGNFFVFLRIVTRKINKISKNRSEQIIISGRLPVFDGIIRKKKYRSNDFTTRNTDDRKMKKKNHYTSLRKINTSFGLRLGLKRKIFSTPSLTSEIRCSRRTNAVPDRYDAQGSF